MIDYVPFNQEEFGRWIQDAGDHTLRLNYNLDNKSIVIDAGGYRGQWAKQINEIYDSTVYVFEPLKEFHSSIESLFVNKSKVIPYNYALSNSNCEMKISLGNDGSTLFDTEAQSTEVIQCMDIQTFFSEKDLKFVNLMKINIEGAEYDLLERMIDLGLHLKVDNLQIQFHRFIEHCDTRRNSIIEELSKSHNRTWNYDWIWENWELKK